jgi:hypothetical protein
MLYSAQLQQSPGDAVNAGLVSTAYTTVRLKVSYMPHQPEKSTFQSPSRPVSTLSLLIHVYIIALYNFTIIP